MTIASPMLLVFALVLMFGTIFIAKFRQITLPRSAGMSILLGMICLSLAAAGLGIRFPDPREAVVMIDLSPSTRTAAYRDPAVRDARIRQLLGPVHYSIQSFGDSPLLENTILPARTQGNAIVLFSDGQFDSVPPSVPIYSVIDPNLENPPDASVAELETRGEQAIATINNSSAARPLQFTGAAGPTTAPANNPVLAADIEPGAATVTARLGGEDPWPENDSLTIRVPTARTQERWWVETESWPANARPFTPAELPTDPAEYLRAGVIVLNNVPASALSPVQQQRLAQFVRDLGGGLVILGGEQAFAAGGYLGTPLETVSPLASAPGAPQRQWIILTDSSGSMAQPVDGSTRWQRAAAAAMQVLGALPPNDTVSMGNFSRDVHWWSQGRSAADTARLPLPPADIAPNGPTNIQPILANLAAGLRSGVRTEIILISDADAVIDDPAALAGMLRPQRASVNLLLTGTNPRTQVLQVVALTSGNMIPQADPSLWAQDAVKLAKSTLRDYVERRPVTITFSGELQQVAPRTVTVWNRTWIKNDATELASTAENNTTLPMAAKWKYGLGQAAATAFPTAGPEFEALIPFVQQAPRDPRFNVSYHAGSALTVQVTAVDSDQYMNGLDMKLVLAPENDPGQSSTTTTLVQSAPGKYEATLAAPRTPVIASIRLRDKIIDHFAVAGRYAQEFDRIGNNRVMMQDLAMSSGGAVIEPSETTPIDFHWPARYASIVTLLSIGGAVFVLLGLILWKLL